MRNVHPAAWIGLLLNIFFAYLLYSGLENVDLSLLPDDQREMVELFLQGLEAVKPYHLAVLAAQALALGLMVSRLPFGLGLALFSSILTMPGSIIYCVGSLLTFYRIRYEGFAVAPPARAGSGVIFKAYAAKRMLLFTGVCLVSFLLFSLGGQLDLAITCFIAALAGLVFVSRANKHHALSIQATYCAVTPGLFTASLLLPYNQMQSATLMEDESIHFTLNVPEGTKTLVWPLNTVAPKERRAAVEELGAALDANGVDLF